MPSIHSITASPVTGITDQVFKVRTVWSGLQVNSVEYHNVVLDPWPRSDESMGFREFFRYTTTGAKKRVTRLVFLCRTFGESVSRRTDQETHHKKESVPKKAQPFWGQPCCSSRFCLDMFLVPGLLIRLRRLQRRAQKGSKQPSERLVVLLVQLWSHQVIRSILNKTNKI